MDILRSSSIFCAASLALMRSKTSSSTVTCADILAKAENCPSPRVWCRRALLPCSLVDGMPTLLQSGSEQVDRTGDGGMAYM